MTYYVEILYKRGPALSLHLEATDDKQAMARALHDAAIMGFNDPVKKITVREE